MKSLFTKALRVYGSCAHGLPRRKGLRLKQALVSQRRRKAVWMPAHNHAPRVLFVSPSCSSAPNRLRAKKLDCNFAGIRVRSGLFTPGLGVGEATGVRRLGVAAWRTWLSDGKLRVKFPRVGLWGSDWMSCRLQLNRHGSVTVDNDISDKKQLIRH
jgi:hypothetical protein